MQIIGALVWITPLIIGLVIGVNNGDAAGVSTVQKNQSNEASQSIGETIGLGASQADQPSNGGDSGNGVSGPDTDNTGSGEQPTQTITEIVNIYFRNDPVANAVRMAEGGNNPKAVNWNCHYGTVSKACLPADRAKAWSVDCGYFQINVRGTTCPDELFDPIYNVQVARSMYERRGWQPWVAYTSGSYKKYLK